MFQSTSRSTCPLHPLRDLPGPWERSKGLQKRGKNLEVVGVSQRQTRVIQIDLSGGLKALNSYETKRVADFGGCKRARVLGEVTAVIRP